MTKTLYNEGREGFLRGEISWNTNTIKTVAVTAGYTFSQTHKFLSDVPGGAVRVFTTAALANKTTTAGVADADDPAATSPATGPAVTALIYYADTGVEATSRLIAYDDEATGLPFTPDGGPVQITFDNGANKIFKL